MRPCLSLWFNIELGDAEVDIGWNGTAGLRLLRIPGQLDDLLCPGLWWVTDLSQGKGWRVTCVLGSSREPDAEGFALWLIPQSLFKIKENR